MARYHQVARSIALSLEAGPAEPRAIPSEHQFCALYDVSRTTVRSALKALEDEGLIVRRQGQGTFFRPRRIDKSLGSIVDFHTEARRAGLVPRTRVLSLTTRRAGPHEAALFGGGAVEGGVVDLVRLRNLDDAPAVLQRSALCRTVLGEVSAADLEDASLYRTLDERRGVRVATVEETLDPRSVGPDDAAHLAIPPGTAVFHSHRVARDAAGAVVEVSDNVIRGDIYRFTIRRQVGPEAAE